MKLPDIIFLCGFMGAGKSTVGSELASKLDVPFMDLDEEVERQSERSIPEIFEASGEVRFREIERKTLMHVSDNFSGVIALGGGSLQNQELLDHLKSKGLLVFIETPLSLVLERISDVKDRPLLLDDDGNPKDKSAMERDLELLYNDRLPLYKQAEISVTDDGSNSPEELASSLAQKIRSHVE